MAYTTNVPVIRLAFSDGFKYYGATTTLSVSATVNLPVEQITHTATGETLADGALVSAQDITAYDVPDPRARGWVSGRSHVSKWSYDVAVNITATGQPTLLWTGTINPRRDTEIITPGMGRVTGASTGGGDGSVTVTEDPNVPGTALIGA